MLRRSFLGGGLMLTLSACSTGGFDFGTGGGFGGNNGGDLGSTLPLAQGQTIGTGPVRVALLLPLSGDPALATIGTSMANGAQMAMEFIAASGKPGNITLVIKDTGTAANGGSAAASQAVSEGASLILGPLKADQVTAAGGVARSAGIPVIAFSNNSGAASPGVYLLNVLPESETRRSLSYVKRAGRKSYAGIFPNTEFGRIQQQAFSQAASELGIAVTAVYNFTNETEARDQVAQIAPLLTGDNIDALFLPDRATAPSFGVLLEQAGVPTGKVQIIGSADWNNDPQIVNTPFLVGALFPAVDDAGLQKLVPQYASKFGGSPHPFTTLAYTAVVLANNSALAMGSPKYAQSLLTAAGGFIGQDGKFKFLENGTSQFALVMKQVSVGSSAVADPATIG